ncbi:sulfurtransferase [Acidihalobacter yilgarnensis]|uniref:Sulfurtransferase n=1 Tax=Acidihalobacter yilgarnensis TaxID=2819280 RepID=A0A1D8IS14_9GAMM|nr:rhodanese-like domain-containing protein [Acidihalobacter yilgarnensis]AOU99269.1 sulfurtransferase [Acidihalobacter yilgarnensis]
MQAYLQFVVSNPLPFVALVFNVAMIGWVEFSRLTSGVKHLSAGEVVQLMNRDDAIVLDVRDDAEVREGMIGKPKHIPLASLGQRLVELDKHRDKTVIAYCRSGNRSSQACRMLRKAGFEKVVNLRGGMLAWREANLPVRKR